MGDVRACVLIPQLSAETAGWGNAAKAVRSLIEMTVTPYGIDKSNISLTGHSMGGTGTWSIAAAFPTLFARVAPLSGSVINIKSAAAKLKNVPVRAFVGSADKIVDPACKGDGGGFAGGRRGCCCHGV